MRRAYVVADGGIGNRLRAIASGIWLARAAGMEPLVVWHRDRLCNAPLGDFLDIDRLPARVVTPSETAYRCIFDLPRRRNFFIPAFIAPLRFSKRYYDAKNLMPYCDDCARLLDEIILAKEDVLFFSGQEFFDFPREFFRENFRASAAVEHRAREILQGRVPRFAVQIRRTDHQLAIESSPEEAFIRRIEEFNSSAPFFLATDDDAVKKRFRSLFGERAVTNVSEARRDTPQGIVDAMAEIWIMAQTERIFASSGSSFPEIASWMGNVELTRVEKN